MKHLKIIFALIASLLVLFFGAYFFLQYVLMD